MPLWVVHIPELAVFGLVEAGADAAVQAQLHQLPITGDGVDVVQGVFPLGYRLVENLHLRLSGIAGVEGGELIGVGVEQNRQGVRFHGLCQQLILGLG